MGATDMGRRTFTVKAEWDDEAAVWYVADSDVPGLSGEGATLDALLEKLRDRIPELVALNRHLIGADIDPCLPIHLMAERMERMVGRC